MEKNIIVINKKIATTTKSLEVTGDIIVPDIKPDIVNIINTNGIPYIYKEDISNGRLRIEGNIDTYVVYLADNGETRSIQTTLTFSDSVEETNIKDSCFSKQLLSLEILEAKVLNERKINIRANVKVKSEIFEKTQVEITTAFDEVQGIEELKETLIIKSLVGGNKIKTSIKEDISVDSSFSVAEILKTDIEVNNLENKISYNKVLAKADAVVKVVFLSEDGRIGMASSSIPIMSFIDIEKVQEGQECQLDYMIRNMLFKVNSKEKKSITCQVDFEVMCNVYESKTIDVIQDMYGIKENVEFTKKDMMVQISESISKERVSVNENVIVEDILNILDVNTKVRKVSSTKSGNSFNCECETILNIFYEADNRNGLNVKEITLPFMVKTEEEDIDFEIANKNFTVSNENVNCELEILIKRADDCMKKITVIDNITISEFEDGDDYKMFMYLVKPGDSIWKIAKHFKVCINDLIRINNLENPDKLKCRR